MSTPCSASTSGSLLPSLSVKPAEHVDVERADAGRRSEQAAAEPGALLVGPVDQRDGDRRRAVRGERSQQLQTRHHAERAVEPAALGHAVEVAADDQHVVALAAQHRPQVPGLVLVDLDGQRGQRLAQHRPRLQPLGRPRQPAAALRPAGVIGKGAQVGDDSFGDVGGHAMEITGSCSVRPGQTRPMPITFRTAEETTGRRSVTPTVAAFGFAYTPEQIEQARPIHDVSRFELAFDGKEIVGVVGVVLAAGHRARRWAAADGWADVGVDRGHASPSRAC